MSDKIITRYDEIVKAAGLDGMKVAEARDKVAAEVTADPDGFGVPAMSTLISAFVESVIGDRRNSRAKQRIPLFEKCRDALQGLTVLGADDPILDIALRTGTADGLDKSLRHFAVDDWLDVLGASAENVAAAIEADKSLRDIVNPIIATYAKRGARCLEDMLPPSATP